MSKIEYEAAWVPDSDPDRDWSDAAEPAATWTMGQAARLGIRPLLVTPTQAQWDAGPEVIARFARSCEATTPRSSPQGVGPAAVLAYVPDYQTMQLAIRYARGGALAVIEGFTTPLCGWAIEVGALDLLENLVTPDLRSAHLRSALDRIHFYGNNGWTNGFGKDATVRLLHDIVEQNELDQDLILGFMLAHGHHHKSIEHLARIIEKAREFNPNRQRANSRRW